MEGLTKAASIYKILGENLPMEVFEYLSSKEIEKLLEKLSTPSKGLLKKEETNVLKEFVEILSYNDKLNTAYSTLVRSNDYRESFPSQKLYGSRNTNQSYTTIDDEERIIQEIRELLIEDKLEKETNPSIHLSTMSVENISQLLVGESPKIIAGILFFSPDEISKILIDGLHSKLKESVILEMLEMDFHSFQLRDELERFLQFKMNLIQIEQNPKLNKTKGRESKKAAHLLNHINPRESKEILSKIQKKRPEYAENIIENFYSFSDLLLLGRKSLSEFIGSFHSIVVATALKGVESELEEEILALVEPWVAKEIKLESNSIGSVTLAEIEESQKGILEFLRQELESGRLKLWRFR